MTDQPPNPPAFPTDGRIQHGTDYDGMTLRDWFAGQADPAAYAPLATLEAKLNRMPTISELAAYITSIRFIEADAMLIERNRK